MKLHGINLPIFALRNPKSSGVGEYLDLIPMIEWCHTIGFNGIQLLPINDSGDDSSPYSALSANALHPLFLSLWALPNLTDEMQRWLLKLSVCNSSERFSYPKVLAAKEHFLRLYVAEREREITTSHDFQAFCKEMPWLDTYAHFKQLKALNEKRPWWEWKEETIRDENEILFHKIVQFFAFQQFYEVKKAAEAHSIQLKGDIPILINRDSSDVWKNPHLFDLNYSAGAPPDMYAPEGQSWGFPLYNWQEHRNSHFQWWKERLNTAEKLYHLYRIDHIVGFFRIWAVPLHKSAKEGFFIPQNDQEWIPQGEELLRMMLGASSMKPIGEDLGTIPPAVRTCMQALQIPGTKVMRWERRWNEDRNYIPIQDYPYLSMTCVSTHDSETLGEWWKEGREDVELFCRDMHWNYASTLTHEQRFTILKESHASNSMYHINLLQEYLNLFQELSWEHIEDERINIPGVVNSRNWTYRFKPTIQEITGHKSLQEAMTALKST